MKQFGALSIEKKIHRRPLNIREIKEEAKDIVYIDEINHECTVLCPPSRQNKSKSMTFVFDRHGHSKQQTMIILCIFQLTTVTMN